jgi:hypothetical protein
MEKLNKLNPKVMIPAPTQSTRRSSVSFLGGSDGMTETPITMTTNAHPAGRKNTYCHPCLHLFSSSHDQMATHGPEHARSPPKTCPRAAPKAKPIPTTANAAVLSGSSVKVAPTVPKADGIVIADPRPAIARMTQSAIRCYFIS